ncbi:MAG: lysophospholipid acyltransferase family protein [Candidatus Tectimicrobiota bacterium]
MAEWSVRHLVEYCGLRSLSVGLRLLPVAKAQALGRRIGRLWYRLDGRHRQVALDNLVQAFDGQKSRAEVEAIAQETFEQFGVTATEVCLLNSLPREWFMETVEIEGQDHFRKALDGGKGTLILTGHFGNWELMGLVPSIHGYPVGVVARPADNPAIDRELARLRSRFGNRVIPKRTALRESLRMLRAGGVVAILIDQNVAEREGIFVEFFGRPACTTPTLALLALKTDATVLPTFCVRTADGAHRVIVEPPVPIVRSGDTERDVVLNTQRFTGVIERYVRQYPDHWLWMHRRWKTQPKPGRVAVEDRP